MEFARLSVQERAKLLQALFPGILLTDLSAGGIAAAFGAWLASGGGEVPANRRVNTTAPLAGGGDLSADRTLTIVAATDATPGAMSAADKTLIDALFGGAGTPVNSNKVLSVGGSLLLQGGAAFDQQVSIQASSFVLGVAGAGITLASGLTTIYSQSNIHVWKGAGAVDAITITRDPAGPSSDVFAAGCTGMTISGANGTAVWTNSFFGISLHSTQLGFYGATPVVQPARVGAVAAQDVGAVPSQASINAALAAIIAKVNASEALASQAAGGIGITA